eukprot:tig00021012_g16987.t1
MAPPRLAAALLVIVLAAWHASPTAAQNTTAVPIIDPEVLAEELARALAGLPPNPTPLPGANGTQLALRDPLDDQVPVAIRQQVAAIAELIQALKSSAPASNTESPPALSTGGAIALVSIVAVIFFVIGGVTAAVARRRWRRQDVKLQTGMLRESPGPGAGVEMSSGAPQPSGVAV